MLVVFLQHFSVSQHFILAAFYELCCSILVIVLQHFIQRVVRGHGCVRTRASFACQPEPYRSSVPSAAAPLNETGTLNLSARGDRGELGASLHVRPSADFEVASSGLVGGLTTAKSCSAAPAQYFIYCRLKIKAWTTKTKKTLPTTAKSCSLLPAQFCGTRCGTSLHTAPRAAPRTCRARHTAPHKTLGYRTLDGTVYSAGVHKGVQYFIGPGAGWVCTPLIEDNILVGHVYAYALAFSVCRRPPTRDLRRHRTVALTVVRSGGRRRCRRPALCRGHIPVLVAAAVDPFRAGYGAWR